jgi:hypothetical protein
MSWYLNSVVGYVRNQFHLEKNRREKIKKYSGKKAVISSAR